LHIPGGQMAESVIDTLIAEAGSDPEGLRAVAWVIQNRATQWGMTPEQVVKQKGQFEGYYNPGPKSREAQKSAKVRAKAEAAWQAVQAGTAHDPTNGGTSFRARGTKQPAPNGTVEIGGNVFALGSGASNSALSAINAAAPTPMPTRPAQFSAFAPSKRDPTQTDWDKFYTMVMGEDPSRAKDPGYIPPVTTLPRAVPPQISTQRPAPPMPPLPAPILTAEQRSAIANPGRGVGTSYLAPATKVPTYKTDNLGNPIVPTVAQTTPSPRSPVGYGPDWNNLQGMTAGAWDDAAPWNDVGPRPPPFVGGVVPSQSKQTPQQIANERVLAGIPVIGPLAVGVGTALDLVTNRPSAGAAASPHPQPTRLPTLVPPKLTAAQRSALASTESVPKPAFEVAPPLQSTPIKVATTIKDGKLVVTKAPSVRDVPKPYQRLPSAYPITGDDIASALYPKPSTPPAVAAINTATLPRLPMMPTPAMSAARLPTVPIRTAPIAPARTPLPQTRTVNPMTQIVPAVQARAGQGLFGGLFNMLTAGNVPQANTIPRGAPTPRPAWQNNPNVQRDDKWAGVLDNFGMII
jgi:hypothetical protein